MAVGQMPNVQPSREPGGMCELGMMSVFRLSAYNSNGAACLTRCLCPSPYARVSNTSLPSVYFMPLNIPTEQPCGERRTRKGGTAPKWYIAVEPIRFRDVASTLEEVGMVYADIPVEPNKLQYFEVAVKELYDVR